MKWYLGILIAIGLILNSTSIEAWTIFVNNKTNKTSNIYVSKITQDSVKAIHYQYFGGDPNAQFQIAEGPKYTANRKTKGQFHGTGEWFKINIENRTLEATITIEGLNQYDLTINEVRENGYVDATIKKRK